jgi:hypothetical protein
LTMMDRAARPIPTIRAHSAPVISARPARINRMPKTIWIQPQPVRSSS